MKKPDFNDILLTAQANMFPQFVNQLAEDLGVAPDSIRRFGVGFWPAEECWIFPERDGNGNVIGLLRRYLSGKKYTWEGSKRGLYYECVGVRQKNESVPEYRPQFIRVGSAGVSCPICGRENDGCLISDEDPDDPAAVICVRTPEGAERCLETGAGYLHRRHPQPDNRGGAVSVLPLSDQPVVVTEGASDCLAAMSMGYVAVGRANADATGRALAAMVNGRDVILVGDRDPHGAGQRGLESCFQVLKPVVRSIVKILPPEGKGKDLRQWLGTGLTREEFEQYVAAAGDAKEDGTVFPDNAPMTLVKGWLQERHMKDGTPLIHRVHGDYYLWEGMTYRRATPEEIRGEWYEFFTDRQARIQSGKDIKLITLRPDRKFCGDLKDAAEAHCNVRVDDGIHEPFLIATGQNMDLTRAVVFQNGILHVTDGRLAPLTPDVFITSTLPYEYNPRYQAELWKWFVGDLFGGDEECVALLQEWFGYNLIASNHMQSMMFFYGVPGSGKSTTAAILRALLGSVRCCGASTDNFKGLFGKEALLNKYAAIMSESRDTNRNDIDKLLQTWKAITGGDVMNVARKYKTAIDARLFCRLTYVANEAIPFDDVAGAMANRLLLLYFGKNYRKQNPDRTLEHRLRQELPGIALWAIEGLKRLLANDRFTEPAASRSHLAQLAELTNPIAAMLDECVQRHVGAAFMKHRVPCTDMYDLWIAWCNKTQTKTNLSSIGFGLKLAHMEHPFVRQRYEEGGRRFYAYQGVSLKPGIAEHYLLK